MKAPCVAQDVGCAVVVADVITWEKVGAAGDVLGAREFGHEEREEEKDRAKHGTSYHPVCLGGERGSVRSATSTPPEVVVETSTARRGASRPRMSTPCASRGTARRDRRVQHDTHKTNAITKCTSSAAMTGFARGCRS